MAAELDFGVRARLPADGLIAAEPSRFEDQPIGQREGGVEQANAELADQPIGSLPAPPRILATTLRIDPVT